MNHGFTLQRGGTTLQVMPTSMRVVAPDGSRGERLWVIEVRDNSRYKDWKGHRTTNPASEMRDIKREYEAIGYNVMPNGPLPINGASPPGPVGPLG